ncbi:permease [Rhodospirillaceae bacterium KN72]|uniref:Permease n=1 Tax=Pacificispira spongiicola TaxID=2729598 RepID=A0A7Y0HFJ9_9PROT|nr:permease [Pacificispira spongiicola]
MSDHAHHSPDLPSNFDFSGNLVSWLRSLRTDRVVWAFLILTAVTVLAVGWDETSGLLGATWNSVVETGPFILLSVVIAATVKATGADRLIAVALSGRQTVAVFSAAAFGALSPFCSCGVVPLIAALLAAGVPLAPVMAFWLASPIIDPEMLVLTWGVLGPEIAIAKTLSAIGIGLVGGAAVIALQKGGHLQDVLRFEKKPATSCGSSPVTGEKPVWRFWREAPRRTAFVTEIGTMGWFLLKWLSIAFLLEAMMVAWVPMENLAGWVTGLGVWSVPAAAAVGVPAYLNGYAAIPLVRGLMEVGLQPGAALAFMVAGGVTCIPAVVAVRALVKTPTFLLYLGVAAAGSVASGLLYSLIA